MGNICLRCWHLEQIELCSEYVKNRYGRMEYRLQEVSYYCKVFDRYIRLLPKTCPQFTPLTQKKLEESDKKMVKTTDIPQEKERFDLTLLPQSAELKATSENFQDASSGKTGGLVINYINREGKTFPQKYSVVSGKVFLEALEKLGIKDTEELQTDWYVYKLTPMRIGFPRMIPTKKVK